MHLLEITAVGRIVDAPKMGAMPNNEPVCNFCLACDAPSSAGPCRNEVLVSIVGAAAGKHWQNLRAGDEVLVMGTPKVDLSQDGNGNVQARIRIRSQFIRYDQTIHDRAK